MVLRDTGRTAGCGVMTDQAGMIEVNVTDKIAEGAAR
ncbi:hypothetical protein GGR90_002779 [Sphingopyxis italica]|uniref:Uncharacterized protein n=1 Tax=Sphingopyxis italica TaxID=1129133 RepID=A0A7X5XSR1_9SPHN|nr:hypothetical protein [Sphingopyxis italica]